MRRRPINTFLLDSLSQSSLVKNVKSKGLLFLRVHLVQGHQTCHPFQGCTVILNIIAGGVSSQGYDSANQVFQVDDIETVSLNLNI